MDSEEEVEFVPLTLSPSLSPTLQAFLFGDFDLDVGILEDMPPFPPEPPESQLRLPSDLQYELDQMDEAIEESREVLTEAVPETPNIETLLGPHASIFDPFTSDSFPVLYNGLQELATDARLFYFWIFHLSTSSAIMRDFAAYSITRYVSDQSATDLQALISLMVSEKRIDQEFLDTMIDAMHTAAGVKKFYVGLHLIARPTSNVEHWPWRDSGALIPLAVPIVVFVDGEEADRIKRGDFVVGAWQVSGRPRTLDPSRLDSVNSRNFGDPTVERTVHFQIDNIARETLGGEGEPHKTFMFPFESLGEKRKRRRGRKAMASFSLTDDGKFYVKAGRRTHDVTFSRFVSFPPFDVPLLGANESLILVDAALRLAHIAEEHATAQETKFQYLMSFLDLAIAVSL